MGTTFLVYEYEEPVNIAKPGDDFELWEYKVKNRESGKEFVYKIEITKSALSGKGGNLLPSQIEDAINTDGKSLVTKGLKATLEYDTIVVVDTGKIIAQASINGVRVDVTGSFL
jgi:hypothetical protein